MGSLLKLQPGIISNNRLGGDVPGDTETPEQFIPATGYPGRDWETCMTMNDTWGYKSYDNNWKSSETLIRNLIDIASKGGNYLLNVGPTSEGVIPQPSVERLRRDGAVVEGQRRGDLRHVGQPVQERAALGPRDTEAGQTLPARLRLAQGRRRCWRRWQTSPQRRTCWPRRSGRSNCMSGGNGLTIKLPAAAPDPIASVVVLELGGPPQPIAVESAKKTDKR